MISITLDMLDKDKLAQWLMRDVPTAINKRLTIGMYRAVRLVQRRSKEYYLSGPRPLRLGVRSGLLRRSIDVSVRSNIASRLVEGVVRSAGLDYSKIHEKGGVIRPSEKKYLAIPFAPEVRRSRMWPRDYPGPLRFIPTARGGILVKDYKRKYKGEKFKIMYLLRKSVKIPPRPYLMTAFNDCQIQIEKLLGYQVMAALEG